MIGDLHCHSKLSDSSAGLEDIVFYAKRAGLDFVAITDHDTMAGVSRAVVLGKRYGVEVIPGAEISCTDPNTGRRVHLLCYLPQKPNRLDSLFFRTLESRTQAGQIMIKRVMQMYPVTEEHIARYYSSSKAIYKVHIMQALLDLGYDTAVYGPLYRQLFGDKTSPSYCGEPVNYPTVEEALNYIKIAKGVAVLAHPTVYQSMELLQTLAEQKLIHGVELYHPKNSAADQEKIRQIAEEYGLITTGGTDFHGYYATGSSNPLATCITGEESIAKLYQAAEKLESK